MILRPIDRGLYEAFLEISPETGMDRDVREFLAVAASISPLAGRIISKITPSELLDDQAYARFDADALQTDIMAFSAITDEQEFGRQLRKMKYRELLKIMVRDVLMKQPVETTLDQLSFLAASVIRCVYAYTAAIYQKESMRPLSIIAMGKLGCGELNFSSDVDLVYTYSDTDIDNVESYNKWAVKINSLLSTVTVDGFLYRVDNDLRPGGKFSPLAMSGPAMVNFYAMYGETWQRVALVRARYLCGEEGFVGDMLAELMPFIFRKYLDFSMISDLRELKARIDAESRKKDKEGINVKLGRGGIREAEFFVQILQIINGGKNARLRKIKIADAVDALVAEKILAPEDGAGVKEAYFFLRRIENSIQMEEERQQYLLPSDSVVLGRVAARLGLSGTERFLASLRDTRDLVNRKFSELFAEKTTIVFEGTEEETINGERIISLLEELPWEDPAKVMEYIRIFSELSMKVPSKYRRHYGIVIVELFQRLSEKGRQVKVLIDIEEFIRSLIKRPVYLSLLAENPRVVEYIVNIFYFGRFLSRILINHLETLDFIISREEVDRSKMSSYLTIIRNIMSGADDFEEKMYYIRQFKNSEWLKIGLMESMGNIDFHDLELYHTNLAEASLLAVFDLCAEMVNEKMPAPKQEFALLGMGKIGTGEMNYFSDLDLIFLYRSDDESAALYNTKLLQKLITALNTVTREGSLYQVDMRLRPTGSQGPLVTSFDNFRQYHTKSSWIFEKQALTKARVLGGETDFSSAIHSFINSVLYAKAFDDSLLRGEIIKMREKIETERADKEGIADGFEIKTGAGGLVDIEFIIQYLKLRFGADHPALRTVNPRRFFRGLEQLSLYPAEDVLALENAHEFLKKLESRLRILSGYSRDSFKLNDELIDDIIFSMGYRNMSREVFLDELRNLKKSVREIFRKILQ